MKCHKRSRFATFCVVAAMLLVVAEAAPAGPRATISVGVQGQRSVELRRPAGAEIVALSHEYPAREPGRAARVVVSWTERRRTGRRPPAYRYRTLVTWCTARRCGVPFEIDSRRSGRRGWGGTLAVDGDRAFVGFGPSATRRWAIIHRTRGVLKAGSAAAWAAPRYHANDVAAYARTPDGRDWVAWNSYDERLYLAHAQAGQRLAGLRIAEHASGQQLIVSDGQLVLTWARRDELDRLTPMWVAGSAPDSMVPTDRQIALGRWGPAPLLAKQPQEGTYLLAFEDQGTAVQGLPRTRLMWQRGAEPPEPLQGSELVVARLTNGAAFFDPIWGPRHAALLHDPEGGVLLCGLGAHAPGLGQPFNLVDVGRCRASQIRVRVRPPIGD